MSLGHGELLAAVTTAKPRLIAARFGGCCQWCDDAIEVGQAIAYSSDPRAKFVVHDACHAEMWRAARKALPA